VILSELTHIFLVLELGEMDLKKLILKDDIEFEESHIVTMLYNQLCALNFLHTANIMHRDIKPGNMLTNDVCEIKICDFGLARSCPPKNEYVRQLKKMRGS
jgi:serine/threonine protein kinase